MIRSGSMMATLMGLASGLGSFGWDLPTQQGRANRNVKSSRRINTAKIRAKRLHHGFPGAKLARKAYLGELTINRQ